ncbi:MAG: UvrD-helicase domain-containing protein [Candidatus Methanomethylophilaceae archaeon]|nr:UvrD-helicase domain-containing protein [Candidatus Methanomethylophilaceae archaeon]
MSDLNEAQARIAEHSEGFLVVDAGPGTGKTHTIVQRYVNIISKPDVRPDEVLLLTFTNNASQEMEERIKAKLMSIGKSRMNKDVRAMTFDAFCLSVVMDYAEEVSDFFGFSERLSRSARLETNETLNMQYFERFFDRFNNDRGEDYGDTAIALSQKPDDVRELLSRLMSKGIMPLKRGWFGIDAEKALKGDPDALLEGLRELNGPSTKKGDVSDSRAKSILEKIDPGLREKDFPDTSLLQLSEEDLESAAYENRDELLAYIHDLYLAFIRRSIADNRLTFGLNALFAFVLLYDNEKARNENKFRYLMIDEFQDTNANQLMISLMILSEPNLCVVGDWKQGIYGFRYVSTENITDFESRTASFRRFLNDDVVRVRFSLPETSRIPLDVNYRSSQLVIDNSFRCLTLKGTEDDDSIDGEYLEKNVVRLRQGRTDLTEDDSEVRFVKSDLKDEAADVVRCVRDYLYSGRYRVVDGETSRPLGLKDIAVICRSVRGCRMVLEAATAEGIPAYLQGDQQVMSTREGKLALAWLRYVNNERDESGYATIMADMGYPLTAIKRVRSDYGCIPPEIDAQRKELYRKRRRVTDLLTHLYSFYNLDNDVTHAIITILSQAHRSSLMTLSDLAMLIDEDIRNETSYTVEPSIDRDAITIMTMHKSKGLEYPAIIVPFIDTFIMPPTVRNRSQLLYDDLYGIRTTMNVGRFGGYSKMCRSWRTALVKEVPSRDYSEERRLMFVAMSRAKQYITVMSGRPSQFMKGLCPGTGEQVKDCETPPEALVRTEAERPDVKGYKARRKKLGVHDILRLSTGDGWEASDGCDEYCSKGVQYGTDVHEDAERMFLGLPLERDLPEHAEIRKVLDSTAGADLRYAEMECGLPFNDLDVTLRGVIDLLAVYPDRVEVHDYKTDETDRFEEEYRVQLSVYAHSASEFYGGRRAVCCIDYVSQGRSVRFDPLPLNAIRDRIEERLGRGHHAPEASRGLPS